MKNTTFVEKFLVLLYKIKRLTILFLEKYSQLLTHRPDANKNKRYTIKIKKF